MDVSIYNFQSRHEYCKKFNKWLDKLDVYYDADFLTCDAIIQKGEFEIFTCVKGNDVFIYPYIKMRLDDHTQFFDITSPYGYAGPFCSNAEMIGEAEPVFNEYITKEGCISEFVRYHYVYNKDLFFSHNIENLHNRNIVLVDLTDGQERIWNESFSATNRNLLRKLKKEGYTVAIDGDTEYLNQFIQLYESTMQHANASDFYYFPRDFYFGLFRELKNKIFLARVLKDGHTYAAALFFKSGSILTYYLSARDINNYKVPASNLLLAEIINYGVSERLSSFNLGGGLTDTEDDSLYKFKKNFSKDIARFYIGKRIHNPFMYKKLKEEYIARNGREAYEKRKHILQFYR